MKTRQLSQGSTSGIALVIVLLFTAVAVLVLASTLNRTAAVSGLNARNNQYNTGLYAAEAATEGVLARMKADFTSGSLAYVTNNLNTYRSSVPNTGENSYWQNFQFSDGQGNNDKTYVFATSAGGWGALQSQYAGLNGWTNTYRIVSNVSLTNSPFRIVNAVQQDVQLTAVPLFQFAIFYNGLLEFTWAAPLTVNGRTHANTNIFVGSIAPLVFNSPVTTVGTLTSPDWFGKSSGQYSSTVTYNGNPGYSTNSQSLTLPIGTANTPSSVHEIINMPPSGGDTNSALSQARYYNKAELTLLVSNSTVALRVETSSSDASPQVITANYSPTNNSPTNFAQLTSRLPFVSVTNSFTDQREGKTASVTQVDVGVLKTWIATNSTVNSKFPNANGVYSSGYPNILYVSDNRPNSTTNVYAVRLVNGSVIPTNMAPSGDATGFTVATPNPLYVEGNYNCPNSAALGTTNTAQTFPASLVSDALTILSANWLDSESSLNLSSSSKNKAVSTTVNAAIITGNVTSTGSDVNSFSGGVQNLPRLLEDWGNGSASVVLTLNTSLVNLYNSTRVTSQFQQPGVYYYAPTRKISFDQNFMDPNKTPPGTPFLGLILRSKWTIPPPNTVAYAGN
jgi:hypothetical protein